MTISSSLSFPLIIGWSKIAPSYLYYILFLYDTDVYDAKINLFLDIALSV